MNIEIAEYSVFFTLSHLSDEAVQRVQQAAQNTLGFDVEVSPRFLEFDYSGRDPGRKVVSFLCQAAPLIGTAEGEAECRITTDTDDSYLEFYFIKQGRLYKQEAKIVRMPPSEVCLEPFAAELQLT